jgi:RNA polymerase II subunit A-like phosphatase
MKIIAPSALRYPFTVVALSKSKNDSVKRSEQLFTWTYEDVVTEANKYGEEKKVLYKRHGHFDAITEGKVTRWYIKPETVVERAGTTLLEIEEPCTHETQFGGLCAECGEDMTKVDYLSREANVERATVNLTHDNTQLKVSHDEAARGEEDTKRRLLNAKKLTLVVDLDQTVIHTTCERTVAEWQADPDNPNYEAVKDVKGFQLADDHPSSNNWYYVKMRPGLEDFFDRLSKLYEMHVYTMATRAYAQAIMKIIDPDRKYFGDRILSRDENYTDKVKSLARLFRNTDMVVIIDDRADVWQYVPHLVRVPVFNFFPGAGDINASFLPKQLDLATRAKPKVALPTEGAETEAAAAAAAAATVSVAVGPAELAPVAATNGDLKEIGQQLISMTTGKGADALEEQEKEQEKVIVAQQTERPLLQQQLMLDKEDAQAEENNMPSEVENGHSGHSDPPKIRHSVLNDDDRGLSIIEKHLVQVHRTFYAEYTKGKAVPAGGRIAELKGQSPKKRRQSDNLPDVAEIMARIKEKVLDGAVVVFSGIIPLGVDVQT